MTAITEYERSKPDIVLMDITMPQMEGIEAAEKIVQQHPDARIVMVSSVGYQENIVAALQRGARHFVQKPVKPEVLYEVIKYVLGEDGSAARLPAQGPEHENGVDPAVHQRGRRRAGAGADSVPWQIGNLTMEEEAYRRKGVAAMVWLSGDIEGRIIFDLDAQTAVQVASKFAGTELPETDSLVREAVCELANQVIGNAVATLNDQGFHFRVHPPVLNTTRWRQEQRRHRSHGPLLRNLHRECVYEYCAEVWRPLKNSGSRLAQVGETHMGADALLRHERKLAREPRLKPLGR